MWLALDGAVFAQQVPVPSIPPQVYRDTSLPHEDDAENFDEHAMSLRRAIPADAAAIRDLTRAAYAKWVSVIGSEPLPLTADYDHADRHHIIDLYEEAGALQALIEMIVGDEYLLIENIAVTSGPQGNGIGDRLLRHAEAVAGTHESSQNTALYQRRICLELAL